MGHDPRVGQSPDQVTNVEVVVGRRGQDHGDVGGQGLGQQAAGQEER